MEKLTINKEIKERYSSIPFNELERFILEYQARFCHRLVPKAKEPNRLFGYNGVNFLLNSLQRSRCILVGFIDCVNKTHRALLFLAVRAHFESTGGVAFFLKHLRKFYNGETKFEDIDNVLFKLSVGGRSFPEKTGNHDLPEAFNVLALIDGADKEFVEMGGDKEKKPFRSSYDFLSEFCHPNNLGLTIASDIVKDGIVKTVVYHEKPEIKIEDFGIMINYMLMSCGFFFPVFDSCFNLLRENEELPDLIK
jgi:hypothetical protein